MKFIGSSHTHSGGGAYFNIPIIGEMIAGTYCAETAKIYTNAAAQAVLEAYQNLQPAKIGIGYGKTRGLTSYMGVWPSEMNPSSDLAIIKITKPDGTPFAVLFNTPLYPAVLDRSNMLFSADVVGYARSKRKI